MKKTILSLLATAITFCAFADGVMQNNSPQTGISTFTSATTLLATNTFPVPYTTLPVVTLSSTSTNDYPWTVSAVTLTNFVLTVSANTTTNCSITWNSYAGYIRIQSGTLAQNNLLLNTNTFTVPYAAAPQVFITSSVLGINTNTIPPIVSSITTTNFIVALPAGTTNQTLQWMSIGTAYAPGVNTVTQ